MSTTVRSIRLRAFVHVAWLSTSLACTAKLPEVPATELACEDDRISASGVLPCPETHWCSEQRCVPRLGCSLSEDVDLGGVTICDARSERCDVIINGDIAATSCERGVHTTETSSRPPDILETCDCPDGTVCVAVSGQGDRPADTAFNLLVLPAERNAMPPTDQLGFGAEFEPGRICARGCSSEEDCPAGHTCRSAAVAQDELLRDPSSTRHTIGVCYPDFLSTSTVTAEPQLVADACYENANCTEGLCQAGVIVVPDHPTVPADEAWGLRRAIVTRCAPRRGNVPGIGCVSPTECTSGICYDGLCGLPCDPRHASICGNLKGCKARSIERDVPAESQPVRDRVFLCDQ